jgi:hypothetical protein
MEAQLLEAMQQQAQGGLEEMASPVHEVSGQVDAGDESTDVASELTLQLSHDSETVDVPVVDEQVAWMRSAVPTPDADESAVVEDRPAVAESASQDEIHENLVVEAEPPVKESATSVVKEVDAVLSLRSKLAEMFGFQAPLEPSEPKWQKLPEESSGSRSAGEKDSDSAEPEESRGAESSLLVTSVTDVDRRESTPEPERSASEDDSVAAYMARLLGRQTQSREASEPKPVAPAESLFRMEISNVEAPSAAEVVEEKLPDHSVRLQREAVAKESIRANIDSFRELANLSARSAVARSQAIRKRTRMNMFLAAALVGWVATGILVVAELMMSDSQMMTVGFALLFSIVFSVLSVMSYLELRGLEASVMASLDVLDESDSVSDSSASSTATTKG